MSEGCCTDCDGFGVDESSPETGGRCWSCYGTGHVHEGPCIDIADRVVQAYSAQSMNSSRSQQSRDRILGPSDLGGCRAKMAHTLSDAPRNERSTPPWAAFVGTWVGEGLERAYVDAHPGARRQVRIKVRLPSGRHTEGSCDVLDPDVGVLDFKSLDGLVIDPGNLPFKNLAQVMTYLLGAIQMGLLPEDAEWHLVYVDRSGSQPIPKVVSGHLDMAVIEEMEERISEAEHAALWGTEAPKDEPYNICESFCLAGETEVVTRQGIQSIASLAGKEVELLVPSPRGEGFSPQSTWERHRVESFGRQSLRTITMHRGKAHKIVRATPEHMWFVMQGSRGHEVVETNNLKPGDVLRDVRRGTASHIIVPPAVAQGFVYGDGSKKTLPIYRKGSDKIDMLKFFREHALTEFEDRVDVRGIPLGWKRGPDMDESNSFLLSWLAGYFAADGSVSKAGQATISSASRDSLEIVRSICAVVGVGYGPINVEERSTAYSNGIEPLYRVTVRAGDLPDWFWVRHAQAVRIKPRRDAFRRWVVDSVEDHGDIEEVYCAIVPGVQAFALSDGLLTHNCEFFQHCRGDWQPQGLIDHPDHIAAVDRYRKGQALEKEGKALKKSAKNDLEGVEGSTGNAVVRWVDVGPSEYTTRRSGFRRLDIKGVK